jgi:hypothetical protein
MVLLLFDPHRSPAVVDAPSLYHAGRPREAYGAEVPRVRRIVSRYHLALSLRVLAWVS